MRRLMIGGLAALILAGSAPTVIAQPYGYDGYPNRYRDYDRYDGGRRYDPYDRYDRYDRYDDRWDRSPRYRDRGSGWERHVRRCYNAYRRYNPRLDAYMTSSGRWKRCRL